MLSYDRKTTKQIAEYKTEYHLLSNISYAAHTIQLHQGIEHEDFIYTLETGVLVPGKFFFCSFAKNSHEHANYESHAITCDFAANTLEIWFLERLKTAAETGGKSAKPVAVFDNGTKKIHVLPED